MYRSKKPKSRRQKKLEKSRLRRVQISPETLHKALHNRCWICGAFMRTAGERSHPLRKSRDHLIPVSEGGKGKHGNVLFAHRECNSRRGNKSLSPKEILKSRYYRIKAVAYDLAILK